MAMFKNIFKMSKFEKFKKNIDNKLLTIKHIGSRGEGISNFPKVLFSFMKIPLIAIGVLNLCCFKCLYIFYLL